MDPLEVTQPIPTGPLAPSAPTMTQPASHGFDVKQLLQVLPALLAGIKGNGMASQAFLQGFQQAQQRKAQAAQQQTVTNQAQQRIDLDQQRLADQEAQRQAAAAAAKAQQQARIEADLVKALPGAESKSEHDAIVAQYEALADVPPNTLLAKYAYTAPTAKKRAAAAITAFLKNPMNATLMKENPDALAKAFVAFDRDGDGIPERVPLAQVAELAELPFAMDQTGQLVTYQKGTTAEAKAGVDARYQALLEKAKAEGKDVADPQLRLQLMDDAQRQQKDVTQAPESSLDLALKQSLLDARKAAAANKPTEDPRITRQVTNLSNKFSGEQSIKDANTIAQGYAFAKNLSDTTENPADDIGLLYAFAKAMDPGSVVREGEYNTVQKYAQSWAQQFGFRVERIFSNTAFLSVSARKNMKATIAAKFQASKSAYDGIRKSYVDRINKVTGRADGDADLVDYSGSFPADDGGGWTDVGNGVKVRRKR